MSCPMVPCMHGAKHQPIRMAYAGNLQVGFQYWAVYGILWQLGFQLCDWYEMFR